MTHSYVVRSLIAGAAGTMSATASPQDAERLPDPATAAPSFDDTQAKIERLQAQVEALREALAQVQASMTKVTPSWNGAPLVQDEDAGWSFKPRGRIQYDVGWSFKPRGRIQYDVGYVSNPDSAIVTRKLGFNARARRIRLGAEGTIPAGLGYKFDVDFANGAVGFGDAILTHAPKNIPLTFVIGKQETNNGLEQMSSTRYGSFVERAAFDDAFINMRRIGLNIGYGTTTGDLRINAGAFAAHSIDTSLDNDGWKDQVRVLPNYSHAQVTGGPLAATVDPTSSEPVDERNYGVDTAQARFQVNF